MAGAVPISSEPIRKKKKPTSGRPAQFKAYKVRAAINVLKTTDLSVLNWGEQRRNDRLQWYQDLLAERLGLNGKEGEAAKHAKARLQEHWEVKEREDFSLKSNSHLHHLYQREKGRLYQQRQKKKGTARVPIKVKRSAKRTLKDLGRVTGLNTPSKVIDELLRIVDEQPDLLLDEKDQLRLSKKRRNRRLAQDKRKSKPRRASM